jgi:hypothetical protein
MKPTNETPAELNSVFGKTTASTDYGTDRKSKRFTPSRWAERMVPVILATLLLVLLVTLGIVILSISGLLP